MKVLSSWCKPSTKALPPQTNPSTHYGMIVISQITASNNGYEKGIIRVFTDFRILGVLLNPSMSSHSYSKDWEHNPFNGKVSFASSLDLKLG
jgi:hypothetical protein